MSTVCSLQAYDLIIVDWILTTEHMTSGRVREDAGFVGPGKVDTGTHGSTC